MTLGGGGMTALEFFQEHRSLARGDDLETSSNVSWSVAQIAGQPWEY
jgi:hypothetical protein